MSVHASEPEPVQRQAEPTGIRIPNSRVGYTVVPNGVLPVGGISARAWGVYVYLLSRPPGWECRVKHLTNVFREGRDALYSVMRELVAVGLMEKETYRNAEGVPRSRFVLVEVLPNPDFQDPGFPNPENPHSSHSGDELTTDDEAAAPTAPALREDVERLCDLLADRIEGNGSKRPTVTKRWREAARLLLDRDGRTEQNVSDAIEWCQNDDFWKANIMSMPKLREKYDRLRLDAQRARHAGPTSNLDKVRRMFDGGGGV